MMEQLNKAVEQVRSIQEQNTELEKSGVYLDYKNVWVTLKNEDGTKVRIKASIDLIDTCKGEFR